MPILRNRHSSVSTTTDVPAPGFGPATPMGLPLATPSTPPGSRFAIAPWGRPWFQPKLDACERRALEEVAARERRAAGEATATAVRCYCESEAFPGDVRAYMAEHAEESYQALKTTRAGKQCVTLDGLHMQDLGEYDMQREIYSGLRRRDTTFNPVAWGLPAKLLDLEPLATPATSPGASGTGVATGANLFSSLTLGLGGAFDTALD
nr:tubby-related protein 1-like isoform X1 [Ipomoea batatas]